MAADVQMSNYWSGADLQFKKVYQNEASLDEKLTCLSWGKIDYLLFVKPKNAQAPEMYFEKFPRYFTKVYSGPTADIWQVQKENLPQKTFSKSITPQDTFCRGGGREN